MRGSETSVSRERLASNFSIASRRDASNDPAANHTVFAEATLTKVEHPDLAFDAKVKNTLAIVEPPLAPARASRTRDTRVFAEDVEFRLARFNVPLSFFFLSFAFARAQ